MSSAKSRRDTPEMIDADAEAGRMLATDADRARVAVDWRTLTAGGPPADIAREATPDRWNCYVVFGMLAARRIAAYAAEAGVHPSEFVRETMLAEVARRDGIDPDDLRENLSRYGARGNSARTLRT